MTLQFSAVLSIIVGDRNIFFFGSAGQSPAGNLGGDISRSGYLDETFWDCVQMKGYDCGPQILFYSLNKLLMFCLTDPYLSWT